MNITKIDAFTDHNSTQNFSGAMLFQAGKACMLYAQGHCLLLDSELANMIKDGKIPEKLIIPLRSRGFFGSLRYQDTKSCQLVRPEFFMIDMTDRCNMKCKYCLRDVQSAGRSIQTATLKEICQYIQDYCDQEHLRDVSIQPWGGEPLLELEAILNMKEWIAPAHTRVHFSIETNAILLTPEVINQLYQAKIGIGISIDGDQTCHDQQRVLVSGDPTHTLVVQHLKQAAKIYGKRLGTITTITRLNYFHIEDILEYFAVNLGLTNVKFNFVHQSHFADCEELCLTPEEISSTVLRMLDKLTELITRGYPIVEKNILTKIKNLLFNEYSDICLSKGCCGGRKMIVFDMDGNIFPCELTDFPKESIGSIFQNERDLISLIHNAMRTRTYFTPKRAEKCVDCPWSYFCGGGCTVRIMNSGNQPPAIDDIECAVNIALYPAIVELVLTRPDVINTMLGEQVIIL